MDKSWTRNLITDFQNDTSEDVVILLILPLKAPLHLLTLLCMPTCHTVLYWRCLSGSWCIRNMHAPLWRPWVHLFNILPVSIRGSCQVLSEVYLLQALLTKLVLQILSILVSLQQTFFSLSNFSVIEQPKRGIQQRILRTRFPSQMKVKLHGNWSFSGHVLFWKLLKILTGLFARDFFYHWTNITSEKRWL